MTMQLEMNLQDDAALDSPAEAIHTPAIRFKGFSGAWETKPFNELCWFQEGPGLRQWQFTNHGIKVINVTNLENGVLRLERTNRHISLEEFKKTYKHFEIDENDIVIASSGNSYGKVAIVRQQDLPLVMNTSVIRFKPLNDLNYDYLLTFLKSSQFKSQIDIFITGGAQPNFGPAHLNKTKINIPANIGEQTKIGNYFQQLDSLITQHQHKHTKLLNLKQALLQKMFPKQGATVPEVRFKGFSGDWEVKKLSDVIANLSGGASIAPSDYQNEGRRTIPKGAVNSTGIADLSGSKCVSFSFYHRNISSKVSSGDLVTSLRDLVPTAPNMGRIVKIKTPKEDFLMPQGVYKIHLEKEVDESFIISYSNSNLFRKFISSGKNGSTQVHMRNGEFLNIDIVKPDHEEQTAIGHYFQQLDHLITQQHALLTKLSNLKQAYLAKMFI